MCTHRNVEMVVEVKKVWETQQTVEKKINSREYDLEFSIFFVFVSSPTSYDISKACEVRQKKREEKREILVKM